MIIIWSSQSYYAISKINIIAFNSCGVVSRRCKKEGHRGDCEKKYRELGASWASSNTYCMDFFLPKATMTIISGPDHITFPFPAPWTTVTSHIDQPLKTPTNTQDPPLLVRSNCFNPTPSYLFTHLLLQLDAIFQLILHVDVVSNSRIWLLIYISLTRFNF